MTNSSRSPAATAAAPRSPNGTVAAEAALVPLDVLRVRADHLARAAKESCRQHERCAGLCDRADVDNLEVGDALELAALADRLLAEATESYERAGAKLHPDGDDAAWWHKANALWMAAREHTRRHSLGDRLSRRAVPTRAGLGALAVEYELEASAMLSLRQAAESYCKARPSA